MNNELKAKALKKWTPVLENMGVRDEERLDWMAEYAELHNINENVAYANQGNVAGMGAVRPAYPAAIPGVTVGTSGDQVGSGDYGQQLLPVAMKIAAQTIGLDLVSVKPSPGPKIDLMYIDFRYDDNPNPGSADDEKPQVWKLVCDEQADVRDYLLDIMAGMGVRETVGGLTGRIYVELTGTGTLVNHSEVPAGLSKQGIVEFLGFSRIDLLPMFRSFRQVNTASSGNWSFNQALNTFVPGNAMTTTLEVGFDASVGLSAAVTGTGNLTEVKVELISALEDHIPGYVSNWTSNTAPMNRAEDDMSYPGIIAPNVFTRTIAVGTIEISTALKRTEIEDIKANSGMDIVQKMESILVNELSQTISKQIVGKIFEMGDLNRISAPTINGGTMNISDATIFDFDVEDYLTNAGLSGETSHAVQRKLISKILNASNYIATEGRVGPAQFVVTNGNLAAALQDIAGYTVNPMKSKMNGSGQLYPVGTIGDVSIYVDPYMKYHDNRIAVGRKNAADQPGLIFIPYLMAQSISLLSEATFAPRMLLRSRYAIGELGHFPQKQYMTIHVEDPSQVLV